MLVLLFCGTQLLRTGHNSIVSHNLPLPPLNSSHFQTTQLLEDVTMDNFYCGISELSQWLFKDLAFRPRHINIQ
jgi:hypothetical protein